MPKGISKNGINKGQFKKGNIPVVHFIKGQKGYWSGKKRGHISEETRKKHQISRAKQIITPLHCQHISESRMGDKNPNYKGGIAPLRKVIQGTPEYIYFRKTCFGRDNFTCQKYGISGGRLVVHHINNFADFPELRTSIENGITLSEKAHKEFHKIYGVKNNTREQLLEFLMKK